MRIGPSPRMSPGTSASSAARRIGAGETHLAHMRNVEQPGLGAGVQMLGQDAGRILHRHLIAGERHHPGAERLVELVERRALERRASGRARLGQAPGAPPTESGRNCVPYAPSVVDPERFTHTHPEPGGGGLTPSVSGWAAMPARCFPERPSARSPFA